jgi:cellulose synthase/poly-beta-1,6-N-acetylglucosamine synthase-like glycosyltransferase
MAHAQKPDYAFRRNGRVHLNRRGTSVQSTTGRRAVRTSLRGLYSSCASLCSAVTWRLLITHTILLFPLHFSARPSPCAITFQLDSTHSYWCPIPGLSNMRPAYVVLFLKYFLIQGGPKVRVQYLYYTVYLLLAHLAFLVHHVPKESLRIKYEYLVSCAFSCVEEFFKLRTTAERDLVRTLQPEM